MKHHLIITLIAIVAMNSSIFAFKDEDKKIRVAKDEVLLLAMVEYDFTALENKNISGIMLYIDTKGKLSRLRIPNEYLPNEKQKQFEFISEVGKRGKYSLNYRKNSVHSSETENLLSVLDLEKDPRGRESNTLMNYHFKNGNIINFGKITIKYFGGQAEDGRIKYQYSVNYDKKDTTMLEIIKKEYPDIYNTYQNEIYDFYNEFEECIFYVVDHVSEDKRKIILQFLIDYPNEITKVFDNLNPQNQKQFASTLNAYSNKELNDFLFPSK